VLVILQNIYMIFMSPTSGYPDEGFHLPLVEIKQRK